jgi:uncharacterized membrane protein YjjP (DUF1212 family)
MDAAEYKKRTRFVIELGNALHGCGASSQRVEKHLGNVTRMLEMNGHFMFTPTGLTSAFWLDNEFDQYVHIERVEPGDINLGRLWMIDELIESMSRGKIPLDEGIEKLSLLAKSPSLYSPWIQVLTWAITGGAFAALVSGTREDVIVSALLSVVTFALFFVSIRRNRLAPLLTILSPFLSGILAQTIYALGVPINVPFVILSSILIFIPGLSLTVAMSEISARHLISGSSRLVEAIMNLLLLLFGAIMGVSAALLFWKSMAPTTAPILMATWKTWPAVLSLSLSLSIAFNIPMCKCIWGMMACCIAYAAASAGGHAFGVVAGMFLGALAVGIFSNAFARFTKAPSSVLSTQGIILLVPGSTTYLILNQWVNGTPILSGTETGSQALMMFVSLVAGLLFANALLPAGKSL